uniref:Uncharacterized protein n=1 Tax=Yersinia pseudotuberculosis serotype O:3 (strain YPIII) TaxID=502800 RepID=A0A0H3B337_YERPY
MINERVLEADGFTGSPILAAIITASLLFSDGFSSLR